MIKLGNNLYWISNIIILALIIYMGWSVYIIADYHITGKKYYSVERVKKREVSGGKVKNTIIENKISEIPRRISDIPFNRKYQELILALIILWQARNILKNIRDNNNIDENVKILKIIGQILMIYSVFSMAKSEWSEIITVTNGIETNKTNESTGVGFTNYNFMFMTAGYLITIFAISTDKYIERLKREIKTLS